MYIYILFYLVPSENRNEELCMKWIQSIKQTEILQSHGGFFMCDFQSDESCYESDLKIIILVLLCLFKFL